MYEELKQDGIAHGMCEKFQNEWKDPNVEELSRFFFRGMDFCIEHDWPSMDLVREIFDDGELAEYGIFIKSGTARNKTNICTMDNSDVHVYVPDLCVSDIYARHNSKVHVHLGYKAFCYVSMYDNAAVFVDEKDDTAKIKASYYGGVIYEPHLFDMINYKNRKG